MSTSGTLIAIQMSLSLIIVAGLVWADSFMLRAGIGVGVLATVAPLTIWQTVKRTKKIGYNSGYTKAIADMIRTHVCLKHDED